MVVPETDRARRFGVGLHLASLAIASRDNPDAEPTHLGGGGIQLRYQVTRRWELELGFATLREQDAEGMPIGPVIHTGTVGALYHMRPGRRWDWYLLGAIGGMHVGEHRDRDTNPGRAMGQLGIGVERRWRRLGIGAELRAVGIAPDQTAVAQGATTPAARTEAPPPPTEDERRGDGGAQFSLAATYYF
jgi:hypothetical protein